MILNYEKTIMINGQEICLYEGDVVIMGGNIINIKFKIEKIIRDPINGIGLKILEENYKSMFFIKDLNKLAIKYIIRNGEEIYSKYQYE